MNRVINRGRHLGESMLNPQNPDQLEEAARLAENFL
jgi:hypothetical protein